MDLKLNEKVYGYYNNQYYLLEGKIIQIGAHIFENFYIGKLYTINTNSGIFKIPAEQVFATYEQWEEYYNIKELSI
jgi:hypothetical protein